MKISKENEPKVQRCRITTKERGVRVKKQIIQGTLLAIVPWLVIGGIKNSYGEDEQETVKMQQGLRFAVPDDWPVEERGGVVAPIPIEEYVVEKFDAIESELEAIRRDLLEKPKDNEAPLPMASPGGVAQSQDIGARLESLARDVAQLKEQWESIKNTEASVKQMQSQMNTANKDSTNEMRILRTWLEDIERRLRSLEFSMEE